MLRYPYSYFQGNTLRPYVLIILQYKKTHNTTIIPITGLLDSGADVCIAPKEIGEALGIDFRGKKKEIFYAANETALDVFQETLILQIENKVYECPFYFSNNLKTENPIILGQKGFFDHFRITFDLQNNEIYLLYKDDN